ncbi:MAG: hypothetical protein CVV37_05530 [Nitrospira bacterium HGW-Nitrospira-1]|nr:MAG: hypothetical protein CVV37_05530 [Nitrospira bacterium HGW-Nitrospira-1]
MALPVNKRAKDKRKAAHPKNAVELCPHGHECLQPKKWDMSQYCLLFSKNSPLKKGGTGGCVFLLQKPYNAAGQGFIDKHDKINYH